MADQKEYGVMVICEEPPDLNILAKSVKRGLPHLNEAEKTELLARFHGFALWKDLCHQTGLEYTNLPDKVVD